MKSPGGKLRHIPLFDTGIISHSSSGVYLRLRPIDDPIHDPVACAPVPYPATSITYSVCYFEIDDAAPDDGIYIRPTIDYNLIGWATLAVWYVWHYVLTSRD